MGSQEYELGFRAALSAAAMLAEAKGAEWYDEPGDLGVSHGKPLGDAIAASIRALAPTHPVMPRAIVTRRDDGGYTITWPARREICGELEDGA